VDTSNETNNEQEDIINVLNYNLSSSEMSIDKEITTDIQAGLIYMYISRMFISISYTRYYPYFLSI
jgi:hypothetical protein